MTIDGVNEVKLHAFELAMEILRDVRSGIALLKINDSTVDVFELADKIYNYISMP